MTSQVQVPPRSAKAEKLIARVRREQHDAAGQPGEREQRGAEQRVRLAQERDAVADPEGRDRAGDGPTVAYCLSEGHGSAYHGSNVGKPHTSSAVCLWLDI